MALVQWTPMGNLQSFQHEMNRMFNQFFQGGNGEEAGFGNWDGAHIATARDAGARAYASAGIDDPRRIDALGAHHDAIRREVG